MSRYSKKNSKINSYDTWIKYDFIKEIEQIWYNYLTPKKGAARADKKTIHAPTAKGGLGLHYLKEFWQALKVSWIKRMAVSRSFWVNILASQTCIEIQTLREIDYLTQGNINKCKNTKNPFWQETFRTFITFWSSSTFRTFGTFRTSGPFGTFRFSGISEPSGLSGLSRIHRKATKE